MTAEAAKPDLLTQILGFLYSSAHYLGVGIVQLVKYILPSVKGLEALADPIGFMAILTVFAILLTVVKKVAIVILIAGWTLILVRVLLMAFKVG
jgi:hypothetical protein